MWNVFQDAMGKTQDKIFKFWRTRSNAILLDDSVPADCVEESGKYQHWKRFCIRKFHYLHVHHPKLF